MRSFVVALLAATAVVGTSLGPQAAEPFTAEQKAAIGDLVRQYLVEHPEVIEEALNALEQKRAVEAAELQKRTIAESKALLFDSPHQAVLGNPKGDITVVEFFDYNCGYCRRALTDMTAVIASDPKVKFVLKEFPVLGPGSEEAARVSVAVNLIAPQKFLDFHRELLSNRGQADKARALEAAVRVGIDRNAVEAKLSDPAIQAALDEAAALGSALGLSGTPSYVVGETIVPGAIGADRLTQAVASVRRCGATSC